MIMINDKCAREPFTKNKKEFKNLKKPEIQAIFTKMN